MVDNKNNFKFKYSSQESDNSYLTWKHRKYIITSRNVLMPFILRLI